MTIFVSAVIGALLAGIIIACVEWMRHKRKKRWIGMQGDIAPRRPIDPDP